MATPEDFDSRTEPATQRRREEVRREGQVAFSGELSGGLLLLATTVLLVAAGRGVGGGLLEAVRGGLADPKYVALGAADAAELLGAQYQRWLAVAGGFLVLLLLVGIGTAVAQV